jgi:hypothetical protein
MHVDRRLVGFGLFLSTVGIVMVAVHQGVVTEDAARQSWTIWPLILVGVGLSIVLAGRSGAVIGSLVLALTFGVIVGGIAATGAFPGVALCASQRGAGSPFTDTGGDLQTGSRVTVSQDCGDLTIGTVAGSTWNLSGESRDGSTPRIDRGPDSLRITTPEGGPFDLGRTSAWDLVLPRDPALDLMIGLNGGQGRVALGGANVRQLSIDANAGSIDLDLRDIAFLDDLALDVNFGSATIRLPSRSTSATITVNAGSASLCLPAGAGLRVKLDSAAASNDFASHGLILANGAWETPGYAGGIVRLDIRADVNAGSLSLDPARACAG